MFNTEKEKEKEKKKIFFPLPRPIVVWRWTHKDKGTDEATMRKWRIRNHNRRKAKEYFWVRHTDSSNREREMQTWEGGKCTRLKICQDFFFIFFHRFNFFCSRICIKQAHTHTHTHTHTLTRMPAHTYTHPHTHAHRVRETSVSSSRWKRTGANSRKKLEWNQVSKTEPFFLRTRAGRNKQKKRENEEDEEKNNLLFWNFGNMNVWASRHTSVLLVDPTFPAFF